jgi:hypothetical protein
LTFFSDTYHTTCAGRGNPFNRALISTEDIDC